MVRGALEPRDATTPEKLFERSWARTVLDRAFGRLREEARRSADDGRYDRLEPFLPGADPGDVEDEVHHLLRIVSE